MEKRKQDIREAERKQENMKIALRNFSTQWKFFKAIPSGSSEHEDKEENDNGINEAPTNVATGED